MRRKECIYTGGNLQTKMYPNNKPNFNRKRRYGNDHSGQNFTFDQGTLQSVAQVFYDDIPGPSYDRGGYIPNKKRQKTSFWGSHVLSNQSSNNQRNAPYGSRRMSPPRPLMSIPGPPPKRRRVPAVPPPKARKDFPPNKVAKPIHPKTNVNKSTTVGGQPVTGSDKELFILRADRVPCQQLTGRLELALGSILKEMKALFSTDEQTSSLFHSRSIQRSLKQCIRERIKSMMLNKYVGKYIEVIAAYRENFPHDTDKEVLDMAILKAGASEQLIKENFDELFLKKLNAIFKKLQTISEGKEMETQRLVEARKMLTDTGKSEKDIQASVKTESEYYTSIVDSLLEARLPKVLPNFAWFIVKMLKRDSLTDTYNVEHPVADNGSSPINVHNSESDDDVVIEEKPDTGKETNNETVGKEETNEIVCLKETTEKIEEERSNEVINVDNNDENSQGSNSVEKPGIENKKKKDTEDVEERANNTETEKPKELSASSPLYLVKVLCQPDLPNKAEAYKFLNKLNVTSVKKHKVIKNLLVVGFNSEKDFDNALAASGTVIENSTLIIKGNKAQQPTNTAAASCAEKKADDVTTKETNILTPDLENQITDLLSSIRRADECQREKNCIKDESTTDRDTNKTEQSQQHGGEVAKIEEADDKNNSNDVEKVVTTGEVKNGEKTEAAGANGEGKKDGDTNVYSPSDAFNENSGLDTIKEIEETSESVAETKGSEPVAETKGSEPVAETKGSEPVAEIEPETPAIDLNKITKANTDVVSTPVRSSSRLAAATPSSIRTRRASRLAQNN